MYMYIYIHRGRGRDSVTNVQTLNSYKNTLHLCEDLLAIIFCAVLEICTSSRAQMHFSKTNKTSSQNMSDDKGEGS